MLLDRVEGDARAHYVVAGMSGADGVEAYHPDRARTRLDDVLTSTETDRRAGISDDEWELRVGLGVGRGR